MNLIKKEQLNNKKIVSFNNLKKIKIKQMLK